MKKIIVCIMLLFSSATLFSQQINPTPVLAKQDYLKKSRHQKTTAWCLVGGGFVSSGIGTVIALAEVAKISFFPMGGVEPSHKNLDGASVLFTLGVTAMVASIPFFIAAGKNKRKVMSLSLKNESMPKFQKCGFVYKTIPSLNFKISL